MILAIDTASPWMSFALHDGVRLLGEKTQVSYNQHTVQLTQGIDDMLHALDLSSKSLMAIGISQGYGSYTGLRVGFGVAKGLATSQNLPLIPVYTFDIIAAATPYYDGQLIAAVQAGRKRVNIDYYDWQNDRWVCRYTPKNLTWTEILDNIDRPTAMIGEIDEKARELLQTSGKPIHLFSAAQSMRRAGFLAELAWQKFREGDYSAQANPIYLKAP